MEFIKMLSKLLSYDNEHIWATCEDATQQIQTQYAKITDSFLNTAAKI